jgi:wyosine [tRNA(Phe)-imidazoG37] synthetase (radical SAM superfamily)
MALLKLQSQLVYGPVTSRRLGRSLGLNILPLEYKLCSFNCVYCQYGWTRTHTLDGRAHSADLPTPEQVGIALREFLARLNREGTPPAYITFSGNGEPTLHPEFDKIVDVVRRLRDEMVPPAKVAILSNSTTVGDESVRRSLDKLDVRIMKLDCVDSGVFASYNRPCGGVEVKDIVEGLKKLRGFTLQTLFTDMNSDDESVARWLETVKYLKPEEVQVYTLDRSAPLAELRRVSAQRLKEIMRRVETEAGVSATAY